jgi:lipid-binding SYLF domain-containing protein
MKKVMLAVLIFGLAHFAWGDQTKTDTEDRLESAAKTLQAIANAPDKGIPDEVFKGAKCVAVVPSLLKGGFVFGGTHGRGVATCKLPDGRWSAPAFFTITGGSWGLQIGVEDVSLVMMIMTDDGMRHLMNAKFKIGASASASAGPVGRHASAGTDWKFNTEILTYSRSRGLFAGIDLGGSEVEQDGDSTKAMYGKDYPQTELLTGKIAAPRAAHVFIAAVEHSERQAEQKAQAKK